MKIFEVNRKFVVLDGGFWNKYFQQGFGTEKGTFSSFKKVGSNEVRNGSVNSKMGEQNGCGPFTCKFLLV